MASFSEALYSLSAERLRALVQARGIALNKFALTPSKRQLVQHLASELSRPESIIQAIALCNARELRLLQLLLPDDNENEIAWERVLVAAGGPALDEALSAVMTRLEDLGLAFRLSGNVFLPPAVRNHVPASLPDRYSLTRCLNAYDAQTLKRIYHNLGLEGEPGSNPEIIAAIRSCLLPGDPGMHLREPLDEEEVAVLEYLVQVGGWASAADVVSAVLPDQAEDFFRYNWQNRWKQSRTRNAIDRLLARGILHVVAHGYALNLYLMIPGDLLRALTGDVNTAFWTRPLDQPTPLPAPPTAVTRHTGLLRDVVSLLAHIHTQDAVRTNTGHIHKASLKAPTRSLSLPEERYAAFLYAICRQAKLIEPRGEKQVYTLTEEGESWLYADATTQAQSLFTAWRDGFIWAEMYNDPLFKADDYRPTERLLRMRHATLSLLMASPPEAFADIGSLTDVLAFRHPLLLAQSAAMGPDLVASPAAFVRRLVGECLYWLGLAKLGWTEAAAGQNRAADSAEKISSKSAPVKARGQVAHRPPEPEMTAYRLTSLGAYLLGVEGAKAPEPEPREDKFLLQANAEIFVPPYLEPTILYPLLLLTEAPGKGTIGNVVRLTRESIRAVLDRGMTSREIIAFLQSSTRTGIPQNIEYLINEVADRHGHIHIGRAQMYLQVDSPLLLQELQARRELKSYAVHILSDTVALLQADDVDKLLRDLRKAGYAPVSDDAPVDRPILPIPHPPTQAFPPATPIPPRKHQPPAESGLDWKRIAQEDGLPWNKDTAAPSRKSKPSIAPISTNEPPPTDGVTDPARITKLLTQAARNRRRVEISYRRQNEETFTSRIIEPRVILGDFVSAYCRQNQSYDSFNIKRMQWARLTDETFEA